MMKKNILYVPAWYPCSFFEEQAELVMEDYNVVILSGTVKFYTILNSIKHINKFKNFNVTEKTKHKSIIIPYITNLRSFFITKQIEYITTKVGKIILSLFSGTKPDVIHIQSNSDIVYFIVLWAKRNNIKVVLTEHLLFIRHEINRFSRLKEKVYEMVDEVLCVSNYVYRNLITSGFKIKKASIIGNLIDDRLIPKYQSNFKNGRVLFVANHYHDKGLNTLLDVAFLLNKHKSTIFIDIIGLDKYSEYEANTLLVDEMNRRGVSNRISLLGKISHEELLKTYPKYSVLLSTSISETFGLAVAESIACGTKVVCTDSGGIRDFVNENNGLIVNHNDIKKVCISLDNVIKNYRMEKVHTMEIVKNYGRNKFKQKLVDAYK